MVPLPVVIAFKEVHLSGFAASFPAAIPGWFGGNQ
jgi:hypothetical protein